MDTKRSSRKPKSEPVFMPAAMLWSEFIRKEKIGVGNCGDVWEVQHFETGSPAACKILQKAVNPRDKVLREVETMGAASGHENVVSLLGAYEDDKNFYLLMEMGTAGCLLNRINEKKGLGEDEARHLFRQIVASVGHCHDRNIVHRDIKPDNIVLCHAGEASSPPSSPCSAYSMATSASTSSTSSAGSCQHGDLVAKLADFGLAVPLKSGRKIRNYAGSFPYEAPEVTAEDPCYNHSADIWSLGVLLYVMLFTRMPPGDLPINGLPPPARLLASAKNVSPEAVQLLRSILQVNPKERPGTDVILSSAWLAGDAPSPPASPSLVGQDEKQAKKRWTWGFRS